MNVSKLYVGNLKYTITEGELEVLFSNYGAVKSVKVIEGKGFGFVEMESIEDAEAAMEDLNGEDFQGRTLRIDEARPPQRDNRGGGRGGYGGGGGGGRDRDRGRGGYNNRY